jgi:hypothetical protein
MRQVLVNGVGLVAAVFFFGSVAATSAEAKGKGNKEKHTVMERLHNAHKLLTEADHDYDGHRAKAAEAVHKAIMELEGKHPAKKTAGGAGAATAVKPAQPNLPAVHEPQASSDSQLRKAREILDGAEKELQSKHPGASTRVAEAIKEIDIALGIK